MANIAEGQPPQQVCETGLSGLVATSDPMQIEDEEIKRKDIYHYHLYK